jgi:hypothetical protein
MSANVTLWIAAGVEMVGLMGASLCALLSPPMTLSVEGSVDEASARCGFD